MANRVIKLGISIIFFIFYRYFRFILSALGIQHSPPLIILNYHLVTKEKRIRFIHQMDELIRVSKPVFPDFQGPLTSRVINTAVTFDDGFQCVLDNAIPELIKRKIPCALFIPTGYLGKLPGWINDFDLEYKNELIMNSEQLKSLPLTLVKVGSHTITHPNLTLILEENILRELIESKRRLENILNKRIDWLAFPHGEYNNKILEFSKQAGYKLVFAALPVLASNKYINLLKGRICVSPDDWFIEFELKIRGAYQWLPIAVNLKRKVFSFLHNIF